MQFLKKLIKKLLLLNFFLLLFLGYQQGTILYPRLKAIEPKNPEKYAVMVEQAKAFHLKEAKEIFDELEAMTEQDVIWLRYHKIRDKWENFDDHDRQKYLEEVWSERKDLRDFKQKSYDSKSGEVLDPSERDESKWLDKKWEKMPVWDRALILRHACGEYLQMEIDQSARRKDEHALPGYASNLKPFETAPSASRLCAEWIPLGNGDDIVPTALKNLRENMNLFMFKEILRYIGIPEEEALGTGDTLRRWTSDYPHT